MRIKKVDELRGVNMREWVIFCDMFSFSDNKVLRLKNGCMNGCM